jgi:hypothetical protein
MPPTNVLAELEALAGSEDFESDVTPVVYRWIDEGVGREALPVVLRFMETHPELDFGAAPGMLPLFIETQCSPYAAELFESLRRQPSVPTVRMLHALLNSGGDPQHLQSLVAMMQEAAVSPRADEYTRCEALELLELYRERGLL